MNARDYGQHASGYRRPELDELPRGFMVRLILWAVVFAFCIGWVMSRTPVARIPSAMVWPPLWDSVSCHCGSCALC